MEYPAIYNSDKEALNAIKNGVYKALEVSKKEDFVRLNIDKLTHINGKEVVPRRAFKCDIEFIYKGDRMINFAHIIYSNLTFKD